MDIEKLSANLSSDDPAIGLRSSLAPSPASMITPGCCVFCRLVQQATVRPVCEAP
jgi:hypothetical protein